MAKEKTCYVCASCGYETARWLGCCPDCGEWNTFEERKTVSQTPVASKTAEKAARYQTTQKSEAIPLSQVQERSMPRSSTGNEELDRVLGGGLVPGSAILIGGDPGIGKSTLLLQVAGSLSRQCRVLYVSGEESAHQIKMRASRIGVPQDTLYVLTENDVESVLEKCGRMQPDVLVIDSIQTMVSQDSASAPGSVSQVRQSAGAIVRFAKETGTSVFIVGHVTKEGSLAGPRVLEHMVDAVLYFEGTDSTNTGCFAQSKTASARSTSWVCLKCAQKGWSPWPIPAKACSASAPAASAEAWCCARFRAAVPSCATCRPWRPARSTPCPSARWAAWIPAAWRCFWQ